MFQKLSFPPFAFSPVAFAIQGLIDEIKSGKHLHQDTDQLSSRRWSKTTRPTTI